MPSGETETLAIPTKIRRAVDERDQGYCRFCGQYAGEQRALHHIRFGGNYTGIGGRRKHSVDNILTVGWRFQHSCHQEIHKAKSLWLPLTIEVLNHPGMTVLQLYRWQQRRQREGAATRRR